MTSNNKLTLNVKANRREDQTSQSRTEAESMLREIAFVLQCTRKIREAIESDENVSDSVLA